LYKYGLLLCLVAFCPLSSLAEPYDGSIDAEDNSVSSAKSGSKPSTSFNVGAKVDSTFVVSPKPSTSFNIGPKPATSFDVGPKPATSFDVGSKLDKNGLDRDGGDGLDRDGGDGLDRDGGDGLDRDGGDGLDRDGRDGLDRDGRDGVNRESNISDQNLNQSSLSANSRTLSINYYGNPSDEDKRIMNTVFL
jgi:hypothetical protein